MLRKLWLTLLLGCLLSSCGTDAPKVTGCLVDAPANGCDCYNEATGQSFFLTLAQCDKYVAFSPTDAQTLLNFCSAPGN